jgi:NADP-dependent 3-hydroxy acid dehydrogenase YdfG
MATAAFVDARPAPQRRRWGSPLNPPIRDWRGCRVWIVGASSGIGAEVARQLIAAGATVALSARREVELRELAAGSPAEILPLDITDAEAVAAACARLCQRWGEIDLVLWVAGTHSAMRAQDFDLAAARRLLDINLGAVMGGLAAVLPVLLAQRRGGLALVSSVAGYSGLPKALVYGPSKAALINLAESLYFDLRPEGIGVYLVSPGFVDTRLTRTNDFKMPALIGAEEAARETLAGIAAGQFEIHYPKRFTRALKFARLLPYRAYFWVLRRLTRL